MVIECGSLAGEAELLGLCRILGWAFGFEAGDARIWLDHGGLEHVRVARRGGVLAGGLLQIPMGQWFGGRSVTMLGVAGVGVAPEARGERVALTLMLETLREARARGVALSSLYPATVTLYRAAGYELAGSRFRHSAELKTLPTERGPLRVVPLEPGDVSHVESLYRRAAAGQTGFLDRAPYIWQRARGTRKGELHPAFGVHGPSGLEGYAYVSQRGPDDARELVVHDFVAATPAAAARLLAFFADHRSTVKSLVFMGASPNPLVLAAKERLFKVELSFTWMLRVISVEAALLARGYPPIDTAVDLELVDRTLPENSGRYRLEVSGGIAQVTRGGSGAVRLDERALAALYSGYLTPAALALDGDAASLARLAVLFAGPPPAMSDFF
ncbi:MAG TPA: GNAT family N-acetyltransferase [Polyangiaceae bacterium]|jgi:predicted acetyltransferase|nr:GNAT family N-acetyltransferase [Polyangiaceae bacterium]